MKFAHAKVQSIMMSTTILIVVFLLCSIIFAPTYVASADTSSDRDWETKYNAYVADGDKDWYFDEKYLDIDGALAEINKLLADSSFDKNSLKNDPIVVAVIENGISGAYGLVEQADGTFKEQRVGISYVFKEEKEASYKLHPIFDDVILKDNDGNYVYKTIVDTFDYIGKDGVTTTYDHFKTGNIAQDMVGFDNHGVGVTGMIALLIQKLNLEEYIKILPIKADSMYAYGTDGLFRQYYSTEALDKAIQYAYENGADVVNASFNTTKGTLFKDLELDILISSAAGNEGIHATENERPISGSPNALGTMDYEVDEDGNMQFVYYSNWGEDFDIVAPGRSAVAPYYNTYLDDYTGYGSIGGTSMATALTTFASALVQFRFRGFDCYNSGIELTPKMVKEIVASSPTTFIEKEGVQYGTLNYKNILTTDFFADDTLLQKTSVAIEVGDLTNVKVGDTITLEAYGNDAETATDNNFYWWYDFGGQKHPMGYGRQIDFVVPYVAGEYTIYCDIQNQNGDLRLQCINPASVSAKYLTPTGVNIAGDIEKEYNSDNTTAVTLTATISNEYAQTNDTLYWWYESNGKTYEIGTGMSVQFAIPKTAGEYVISCAFKDADNVYYAYCTNPIEFSVIEVIPENENIIKDNGNGLDPATIGIIVAPSIVLVVGLIVLIVLFVKRKNSNENRQTRF